MALALTAAMNEAVLGGRGDGGGITPDNGQNPTFDLGI